MRRPDDNALFLDMLTAAREARSLAHGYDEATMLETRVLALALERLVQNIGEAASRLTPEGRAKLPDLPWKEIVAMRHRLVHDYPRVDSLLVWDVVQTDLPVLIEALESLLPAEE